MVLHRLPAPGGPGVPGSRAFRALAGCLGLTPLHLEVLVAVAKRCGWVTTAELSSELGVSKATLSRVLLELHRMGLLERERVAVKGRMGRRPYGYRVRGEAVEKLRSELTRCVEELVSELRERAGDVQKACAGEG